MIQPLGGKQLLNPLEFRDLVSGRKRGIRAAVLRAGLQLAELPYGLGVRWRNHRFDRGISQIHQIPAPVVSVGNLTVGGTGKTPMVEWVVRWFRRHGLRVAVVSRGYGAEAGARNDEALELEQKLVDVPHLQNPDRVAGARTAIEEFDSQVIVLDDAFQHRRIARDLDIVLLDGLEPFGFGHLFPRGTLREPPGGLRRAQIIVLSRADLISPARRDAIRRQTALLAPRAAWAEVVHAPRDLRNASGREESPAALADLPVAAFCGIGNPAGFRQTLKMCGYRVIAFREFADHYRYARADVERLIGWVEGLEVAAVLCTHKDLVKLGVDQLGSRPLWALVIALEFLAGQEAFEARLAGLLPKPEGRGKNSGR
jgi:tetraacyldisaccharide 4'-kinase